MTDNQEKETTEEAEAKSETAIQTEAQASVEEPVEEKAEINKLLDEGYSVKQIIELGFNRRTAYHYAKQRTKPENEPASSSDTPAASSNGKGRPEMIKLGSKDVIPPEAVLEVLHLPQEGEAVEVWRRGVIDGVGFLLLGARYAQMTAAGQAEIVKNQLDIMREAKDSNADVARQAAQETAMEMSNILLQKMPRPEPQSKEPNIAERVLGPMAEMAGKQMATMFSKMFGLSVDGQTNGGQFQVPSGWEYENKGGVRQ